MSFRVLDRTGEPASGFTEVQTKLLHLYVVRTDYAVYRHVHPTLSDDGTWTAPIDLAEPGDYRVIADFQPAGGGRPVVLGQTAAVPGPPTDVPVDWGDDGMVSVAVYGAGSVGDDGRLHLLVTTVDGEPVTLGSYLGTSAHVSGFRTTGNRAEDATFVHMHPYGEPEVTDDGTRLTFHTAFEEAGDCRLFVQVRVDGLPSRSSGRYPRTIAPSSFGRKLSCKVPTSLCDVEISDPDGEIAALEQAVCLRCERGACLEHGKDLTAGSGLRLENRGPHKLRGLEDEWILYAARD